MNKLAILFLFFCLSYLSSCYYDVGEELYPGDPCDVSNITFSGQITTTLKSFCLNCHSKAASATLGGGITCEEYKDVKTMVDNGKLFEAITHTGTASPMPKGAGSKIPECHIKFVQTWIAAGAPNN